MTVQDRLPTHVRALIAVIGVAGVAATAVAWSVLAGAPLSAESLGWLAVVVLVVVVGDVALLEIRLGRNNNSFTWAEAALVVGVAIGGWATLIAVLGPVVLIRQVVSGRPLHKAVFNGASAAVSAALAWLAFGVVSGHWDGVPTALDARAVLGLAAATGVYFLAVSVLVATVVAWAQGLEVRSVWERGSRLRTLMFFGNSAVGLGAVLIAEWNRPTVVVLPFVLLLLYGCYNSALKAQQERDLWREMHAATLRLNRVELPAVLRALEQGAGTLFGSEHTALLVDDDLGLDGVRAPALLACAAELAEPVVVDVRTTSPEVAEELRRLGLVTVALAPLVGASRGHGALLLGFRAPVRLSRRQLQMIGTFADQASISLQHGVLFDEIEAQRSRLSTVLDNASDGILLVDGGGVVRSWNPAMEQLTGRSEREAVGAPLDAVLPGTLDDGQPLSADRLFAPGEAEVGGRIATADGERDVSLALATVDAPEGAYAVVVARDVTAQREVQQAKEDFIATVSHELRTPLTPIKGYLRLLQRRTFSDDPVRREEALTVLVQQSEQLERLVEDLLSVSRMRHGQFDVLPEVGDVAEIVERAVRDQRLSSPREVHYRRAGEPVLARCDPARLQQVVTNLLSNADKYSPAGQPVSVAVDRRDGDVVEITVVDRGSGVPAESREAVFEPFQRLGHHLTRETRGTGLGLHIAKRLIGAMGGRIWVDGATGEGASFHVTVPAASVEGVVPDAAVLASAS